MPFHDMHRPIEGFRLDSAVRWIILLTGVLLLAQQFAGQWIVPIFGLVPYRVTHDYWFWQPFTYLFLHGGLFHWLFNMLVLWMFGSELERRWGTWEFLKYFFITGTGAALVVLALGPTSITPTVGSSGAVFGMIVAFALMYPDAVMYMYFLIPLKVWQAAVLFSFIEFFAGLEGGGQGISRFAHLGGMIIGFIYLKYWSGVRIQVKALFRMSSRPKPKVEFHEVTDELVSRVDKILEKVSKEGAQSLTPEEKKIMDRYSKQKR